MFDVVAAQDIEPLLRADHQASTISRRRVPCALHNAGHAEAANRETRPADKREHEKQRCEISSDVDQIHARI